MSNNGDEDLERRLRDVLNSRGLGVPVSPDAIDRIHAGARRRQQRRAVASSLGAVAVIVIAAVAIGVRPHDHGSTLAAHKGSSPSPTAVLSSSPQATPPQQSRRRRSFQAQSLQLPSSSQQRGCRGVNTTGPKYSTPSPSAQLASTITGCSDTSLRHQRVTNERSASGKTTDAGDQLRDVGHPAAFVAQMPASVPPDTPTLFRHPIRRQPPTAGYTAASSLRPADGGMSWSAVTGVPGTVVDLAAASGNVWASRIPKRAGRL